ncbi:MAG: hypothetical protein IT371_21175 [Deltaproteobacteria bacterium]|nr:hypothetical protein [Deltaproteobacteria bacterium]
MRRRSARSVWLSVLVLSALGCRFDRGGVGAAYDGAVAQDGPLPEDGRVDTRPPDAAARDHAGEARPDLRADLRADLRVDLRADLSRDTRPPPDTAVPDALTCPPGCTSCDLGARVCRVTCNGTGSGPCPTCPTGWGCELTVEVTNRAVRCSGPESCRISCTGINSCNAGLECGSGPCSVTCSGHGSCTQVDCAKHDSASCNVTCQAGTNVCPGDVQCGTKGCAVSCSGASPGSCKKVDCSKVAKGGTCRFVCTGGNCATDVECGEGRCEVMCAGQCTGNVRCQKSCRCQIDCPSAPTFCPWNPTCPSSCACPGTPPVCTPFRQCLTAGACSQC